MARFRIKNTWSTFRSEVRQTYCRARGKEVLHFLHVSKTGGTALKHVLRPYLTTPQYAIVLHGHRYKLRNVRKGDKVIFCLRDPISRFVSGFYSRFRQGQPRFFVRWSEEEEKAFSHFNTPNRLALALSSDDDDERMHARQAMHCIAHVKDGYLGWFESEEYLLSRLPDIFLIGFQETLTQDFERLRSKLGLPDSVHLPYDDVTAHRNPDNLDKKLDAEARANLTRWYAADVKLYSLCRRICDVASTGQMPEWKSADAKDELLIPTG